MLFILLLVDPLSATYERTMTMTDSYKRTLDKFQEKITTSMEMLKNSYALFNKSPNPIKQKQYLQDITNLIKHFNKLNIELNKFLKEKLSTVKTYVDKIDKTELDIFHGEITSENCEEFFEFVQHCQLQNIAELLYALKNFQQSLEELQLPLQIEDIKSWNWEALFSYSGTSYSQSMDEESKLNILSYKIELYLSPLSELTELFNEKWSKNFEVIDDIIPLMEQAIALAIKQDNTNPLVTLGNDLLQLTETWHQHSFLMCALISEFPSYKFMTYYAEHFPKKICEKNVFGLTCLESINEYLESPESYFLTFEKTKYVDPDTITNYIQMLHDKISFLLSRGGNFISVPLYEEYMFIENFFNAVRTKNIDMVKDMLCIAKKSHLLDVLLNTVDEKDKNVLQIAADPITGDKDILHRLVFYGSFLTFRTHETKIILDSEKEHVFIVSFYNFFKKQIIDHPKEMLALVETNLTNLKLIHPS